MRFVFAAIHSNTLANFFSDLLAELSWQRREAERRPLLATTGAFD
jgi:hypothetical protein